MDKSEIRDLFLGKIKSFNINNAIIDKLEELSIFDSEKQLKMEQFYDKFYKIVSWQTINNISYTLDKSTDSDEVNTIINILSWAIKSWVKAIETADINKIVISYLIIERMYLLPELDLSWDIPNNKLKQYLEKFLPTIRLEINTSIPKNASYSDKKFQADYEKSCKNNNYGGIFTYFSAIDRGNHIFYEADFFKVLTKISYVIDPHLISKNISNYSPFLMKYIIGYLDNKQIIQMLSGYLDSPPLPLLIGLVQIVNPIGNNRFNSEFLNDYNFIKDASIIIEKISTRITVDNLYNYITNCSNISRNNLWHSIFSAFLSGKQQYFNDYVNEIDFTHDAGEISFNIFSKFSNNSNLDKLSLLIYNKYLDYFDTEEAYHTHLFCFTSYYKYILRAIRSLSNMSFSDYLKKLEQVSIELKRCIYSWDLKNKYKLFTKWIFWIISSEELERNCEIIKDEMETTFGLLSDQRILNILNRKIGDVQINFENLTTLLEKPESINRIVLPYGDQAIILDCMRE